MSLLFSHAFPPSLPSISGHRNAVVSASISTQKRKPSSRRKKRQPQDEGNATLSSPNGSTGVSALEKSLRLTFMEELMQRARSRDTFGVSDIIYDMIAAGLTPGPRSFHGLVVAHVLNGDVEGALQALRRELGVGVRPLHETLVSMIRLFGSKGLATKGLEVLAAMEKLNYDIRQAWIILVEELVRNKYLEDANTVFLKGAKGGLRATNELYDLMIEEDCKAGDHSNALDIAYEMEAAGRMATTFHFNCLLSVQATCGIPEIAFATFENMEYGEEYMKPDTETYNWVIQAYTRAESYDRVQDVAELLGMMVEDHKRLQPNVKTYALLVECFTKYCVVREAIRHFRALKNYEGGTIVLHNEGNFDDPLSLYLRALCREGRIVELLEALEAMSKDNQPIPPRAMILSRKYRTLVSSWIEPLQDEAELGYEIDYIARYIEEGGLTGERKRWVPRRGKTPLDPDAAGFIYSNPMETSFKQRCLEEWKIHHRKLLKTLQNEGLAALGDASESDYIRVVERLKKIIKGPDQNVLKPKAASKMVVSELKEELEAQGLPIDGTRNVLYQRVQKARRINRSRGRPLWVPPVEEEEEEVDEELDELISRIKLEEGNTEFWKRRFLGEGFQVDQVKLIEEGESEVADDELDESDVVEDAAKDIEEDEGEGEGEGEEEEEVEQTEIQEVDRIKDKEVEAKKPLQMIGVQLLKDSDQITTRSKKSRRRSSRVSVEDDDDEDWFPEDIFEAFQELRNRKVFDVEDMYTIADVWGWTWERQLKNKPPRRWSQEWEVELAIQVMQKVVELGGTPTIGDCAMILRAAIKAPMPSAFLKILQKTHSLGYVFGSPLYDEVISLCIDLGELDAAIAIVADLETTGIAVPDQTLDRVISARQTNDTSGNDASSSSSSLSSSS
ncbi:plastid transcriptionally active 3, PIGMENT DEFECTIVE 324 [Hibiscus trionum]|uniref:Plastid transcriptionally active 3, PIGMENT DEFECTIVE 324 n=1 Tax=Hibiscus trionum TaxID=183268 RepID=A0A9W7JII5_HIBTR|nr:plastid transcriptionally active 3, PIGMENT DEFECTIVE 324 [Hibiscus trionum]